MKYVLNWIHTVTTREIYSLIKMANFKVVLPVVRLWAWQGIVEESQSCEGGLHGVGKSPGATVPCEPREQLAEELVTNKEKRKKNTFYDLCSIMQYNEILHGFSPANNLNIRMSGNILRPKVLHMCKQCFYRPFSNIRMLQCFDERVEFYVRQCREESLYNTW